MPKHMQTRDAAEEQHEESDAEAALDATLVANEGAPGARAQRPQVSVGKEQLAELLAGISLLRTSVDELRQETCRSQKEVGDLRARLDSEAAQTARDMNEHAQPPYSFTPRHVATPLQSVTVPHVSTPIQQQPTTLPHMQMPLLGQPAAQPHISTPVQQQPTTLPHMQMPLLGQPAAQPHTSTPVQRQPTSLPHMQMPLYEQHAAQQHTSTLVHQQPTSPPYSATSQPVQPATLQHGSFEQIMRLPQSVPPTFANEGSQFSCSSAAKLCPLPQFDGNPEDWPLFVVNYRETTAEFGYSDRQNLVRLHRALLGSAKRAVTSLLIHPENVPRVLEELEFNFGRPDLLIRSQLQKVQQFGAIGEGRMEQILEFANRVRNIVAFFRSARCEQHLLNPMLLEQLIAKLPASKQYEWSRYAAHASPYPTVEMFAEWISELAKVVAIMPGIAEMSLRATLPRQSGQSASTNRQSTSSGGIVRRVLHSSEQPGQPERQRGCEQCSQAHKLSDCQRFGSLDQAAKWAVVKRNRLCFGCLHKGHNIMNCRHKKVCAVEGCERLHHPLLHSESVPTLSAPSAEAERILSCRQEIESALFKVIPVVLSGPRGSLLVYAMFDEGSSISLLEENVAAQLGLRGQSVPLVLQWYGQSRTTERSRKVAVSIKGADFGHEFALKNVRTIKHLNLPTQSFCKENYDHLRVLPMRSYADAKPVLLLGLDNCFLSVAQSMVENGCHQPIAALTKLGWVAFGPVRNETAAEPRVLHIREMQALTSMNKLMEDYFAVESFGVRSTDLVLESDDDGRARKILSDTVRNIGGRYEVGLLWRSDDVRLPESYAMAKQRLLNIENKMSKDLNFANNYKKEMHKYVTKGYARLLSLDEANNGGPTAWYLPHFGVVNPSKPEKLRIVFDAAAMAANTSLNSALMKGPEHAQPLWAIIAKFRQGMVAVAGDIEEMFSQIRIRKADQDAQRFLWREDVTAPIQVYAMVSLMFGAICSPCCAEHVKNINAENYRAHMPRGAKAVIEKTYVDDLVISFDSVQEAEEVTREAMCISAAAGFNLRNFSSNCKGLEAKLNNEEGGCREPFNLERGSATNKILGLFWNTEEDTLQFNFKFRKVPKEVLDCKRPPTKREMLRMVMSVYDPFGFLANFMLYTKLLLQTTWKMKMPWDDPLPNELRAYWTAWWKEFQLVDRFSVSRCYSPLLSQADDVQLHVFVDASISAYAAVAYLRIRRNSAVDVAFVVAKTRCAPPKGMSVPRLELQAAVLGCRLATTIVESHEFRIDRTIFWSDSKTAILWIRSVERRYKQIVAHRVAEILSSSEPAQWCWLPTACNVADDATRVVTRPKFEAVSRWILGPDFLREGEELWPKEPSTMISEVCQEEEAPHRILLTYRTGEKFIDFTKFSSYLKLLRTVAWVLRFVCNVKSGQRVQSELTAMELDAAEDAICRLVHKEVYADEIALLNAGQCLPKSNSASQLTPYVEKGLLRVGGRIDAALCLPEAARCPIILPRNHHVSRLLMSHYHKRRHHQNDHLIINEMRQKFWVPHARALLKSVKSSCPTCILDRAKPEVPLMGQLPSERLTPYVRPFSYTGIDYCGPFYVAIRRSREKRWIALFTCLTTRAIHLEVADDLSTDAFLLCFRNFVNRRGTPVKMRSDNGTNFVGAQKELQPEHRLFDFERIEQHMAQERVEWVFNCPGNPSAGGCWERLIGCVKRLLSKVLRDEVPRLETFRSVVIEAESIVNSRPLTDLPMKPGEDEPLTPNHFLLGCLSSTQTPNPDEEAVCLRKQWRIAQNLKDRLWKRWVVEYLPQLLQRPKWKREVSPLRPGQLVLVCDPSMPRSQWPTGIIENVFAAKDGQVRVAEVRTAHGRMRRPASRLAVLRIGESS